MELWDVNPVFLLVLCPVLNLPPQSAVLTPSILPVCLSHSFCSYHSNNVLLLKLPKLALLSHFSLSFTYRTVCITDETRKLTANQISSLLPIMFLLLASSQIHPATSACLGLSSCLYNVFGHFSITKVPEFLAINRVDSELTLQWWDTANIKKKTERLCDQHLVFW